MSVLAEIRQAWCPTCRTVDTVDVRWRCGWCGTVTLGSLNRRGGRESNLFSVPQLRVLHDRYARGESLGVLAAEQHTGRDTLRQNFWHLGLPTRTLAVSNVLVAPQRPVSRWWRGDNQQWRRDISDAAIKAAHERTKSMRLAGLELGCSQSTVCRRLAAMRARSAAA